MQNCAGYRRQLFYKYDVLDILEIPILIGRNLVVDFCGLEFSSSNGDGVTHYPVHIDWFGNFRRETIKEVMCSGKAIVYCHEKERSGVRSSVHNVLIYSY